MGDYSSRIMDWPEYERPRERLLSCGPEMLTDAEILAVLVGTGSGGTTAVDLARYLLQKCGGFRGIDSRSVAELRSVKGIGSAKATRIKAAIELGKRLFREKSSVRDKILSSADVYSTVCAHLRDLAREVFKVLLLTSRNGLLGERTVFEGSLTESLVNPREIIYLALSEQAASIIFVHNHPSGDPSPSEEDRRITHQLRDACRTVNITVLDHVIIGKDTYYSFADQGLL